MPHLAHCLHHARRVGFCRHLALSNSGSCCPKSPVRVGQVYPFRICRRAASLKDTARLGFWWPFRLLHAHLPEPQTPPCRPPPLQSVPLLSAARLLPFQRSLCPSCASLLLLVVPIHRVVFLSLLFFWTGRLLSSSAVVYFACSLIAFFTNSWARPKKESCFTSNGCRQRAETAGCRRASLPQCRLSRLLHAGLTTFVKRCSTISRTSFTSSAPTPCSFMIFSKPAREAHTLPPAKLLRQDPTGLASDFRLRSAFDVI